ncbi:glycosyltransferase [Parapedobacter sp. 10938]|uniref:glycosyltransferase n=1 Tax=Parapedobacter flavus TaxID=3110225 RepID=UPI002DBE91EF|nr:glycosyltransferase [Parapedobacter sp. 10938]MEC3879897.1 glycosyltransferase [Parapedobacter sp. 10938]
MTGKNILIVGQQPWDSELGSNCKDIAVEFSKKNKVLYVNSPLDRATSIRRKADRDVVFRRRVIAGKENGLRQEGDNLWVLYPDCLVESINWLDNERVFDLFNRVNNKRFASAIKKYLQVVGFDSGFVLFNDNEIMKCFYLKEYLAPELTIYYSRDFIVGAPYWNKHGPRLEPIMIKKSDVCFSNSSYLANYCKQYNSNVHFVGQGFDTRLFNTDETKEMPSELTGLRGPFIGYVGVLHRSRLDLDAMVHIARSRPDWTMVLVGPEDGAFRQSELHLLDNVVFLGMKPMEQLPHYIHFFDVCINPQFLTPLTVGNYPRKIDEYLAMGKPVVALSTHAMQLFADHTYLARTNAEYVKLIERALTEDNEVIQQERIAFVAHHTWAASVEMMYSVLKTKHHLS